MPWIDAYEQCPCNSGQKYKFCCEKLVQKPTKKVPYTIYPERFVVGIICRCSDGFKKYYDEQRHHIRENVLWAEDKGLAFGIDQRVTKTYKFGKLDSIVIRLRNVPAKVESATFIAHELHHLILDQRGFIGVAPVRIEFDYIASSLSSMLTDPIIQSELSTYGLDIKNDFIAECETSLRALSGLNEPSDQINRMHWVFNYVSNILEWEVVCEKHGYVENELVKYFDSMFPVIAEEGKQLYEQIKTYGFETPQKQKALIKDIVGRYDPKGKVIKAPF
ncbi:SEC-C domain-containing protein [Brevibacillus thermoruber]|uniref:SEC-C domain-containing protein n=1 Tax=Brevibacillus thermoruber TaxID=33942 RepID=UPI00404264CC